MVKESGKARDEAFIEPEFYEPLRTELKEPLRSAFTLAYHSAVRVHEMKRLRWDAFDFKRHQIFLSEEVTKTGKARIVPLPTDFDLKQGKADDLPLAAIGERRESTWNEACVRVGAGWFECRECAARCNVRDCPVHGRRPVRGLIYHGPSLRNTRHTAVRNMVDSGVDRTRAKAISGHKTDSMFDRYNIGQDKDVADAREAMESYHRSQQKRHGLGLNWTQ
jgi:integrase